MLKITNAWFFPKTQNAKFFNFGTNNICEKAPVTPFWISASSHDLFTRPLSPISNLFFRHDSQFLSPRLHRFGLRPRLSVPVPMAAGLMPGCVVGQYCLEEGIGDGSFASVWRAHPVQCPEIPIAIKVMSKSQFTTPQAKTRLTREVSLLRKMRHPFISEFFQLTEDSSNYYLVMEHVSRGHLLDYVNEHGALSEDQARRYFTQLIWVLEYLHLDMHIAHRDLKCENVLLDAYDNIRVIDFGLSSQFTEVHPELKTACGSPAYAAPEMIRGDLYTRAADIWSSGILLFAIIAGYLPFDDENVQRLLQKIVYTEPVYPARFSPPLVDLLQKMICKDPEARIDIAAIQLHPWFSQTEYSAMREIAREAEQATEFEIDSAVIGQMTQNGIDCRELHESLLMGAETPLSALYRVFCRRKLTEGLRGLMQKVAQGGVKPRVGAGVAAVGRPTPMKLPMLNQLPSRPGTPGQMPSVGGRGMPRVLAVPVVGTQGRKMSRPLVVRRPVEAAAETVTSHETP
jgi:hypothetical protein